MRIFSNDPNEPGFFAVGQVACGVIAIGQSAIGVVAIGQIARGIVSVGQLAIGVVALGQGAIGVLHGSAMVGIAGQRGWGFVWHTLPRIAREAPALRTQPTTPIADLISGAKESGWLGADIDASGVIHFDERTPVIDTRSVRDALRTATTQRHDRALVFVSVQTSADATAYREGTRNVKLRAEELESFSTRGAWTVRYNTPPEDKIDSSAASAPSIAMRTIVWLVAAIVLWMVAIWPLGHALGGWPKSGWWGTINLQPSDGDDSDGGD